MQHFVWHRVKTVVHNLIIGTLYVDNLGEMVVRNMSTGTLHSDLCNSA